MDTRRNKPEPSQPPAPKEICRRIKAAQGEIRELLVGIYGDPGSKARGERFAWPEDIRKLALSANCGLNSWMLIDFGALHSELGLGAVDLNGECEHVTK